LGKRIHQRRAFHIPTAPATATLSQNPNPKGAFLPHPLSPSSGSSFDWKRLYVSYRADRPVDNTDSATWGRAVLEVRGKSRPALCPIGRAPPHTRKLPGGFEPRRVAGGHISCGSDRTAWFRPVKKKQAGFAPACSG